MRVNDRPRTRREQIEQDFLRSLKRKLKRLDIILPDEAIEHVLEALKWAALVGASEERDRTLRILRSNKHLQAHDLDHLIINLSVQEVLGYEN